MLSKILGRRTTQSEVRAADGRPVVTSGTETARHPRVWHPYLIGIFPIVSLYAHNVYEIPPRSLTVPIGLVLAATFVVWLAFRLITGNPLKAGLVTTMFSVSFFGFKFAIQMTSDAWRYLSTFWVYHQTRVHPLFMVALIVIANLIVYRWVIRRSRHLDRWTSYLNGFTMLLVTIPAIGSISDRVRERPAKDRDAVLPTTSRTGWTPDIYFIVLDGYARSDVMKELFDFDNEPFLERLEQRGFFVARQSTSNYCQTRLSISSTLNANYLDKLIEPSSNDLLPLSGLIKDNLVGKLLRPLGYKTVSFATGFEPTDQTEADVYLLHHRGMAEFSQILVEMTPIASLLTEAKLEDRYSAMRDRTLYLFDKLPTVAEIKQPTFTFAHVMSPHPPFVFGEEGEDVSPRQVLLDNGSVRPLKKAFGSPEYFRDSYRKQAAFLTAQVERTIDRILAASPEPPIIILQSDHGSWLRYHPDDLEATDLRERFGILNCIYVPDRKIEGLDDRMTSVNTFRTILRAVIGADLPPLEDRSFFSPFHDPLLFTDITKRLHSDEERKRRFQFPSSYPGLLQQF